MVTGENCNSNKDSLECCLHETEKKNYIRNHRLVFYEIPGRRIGRRWMFDKDKIDELLRKEQENDKGNTPQWKCWGVFVC